MTQVRYTLAKRINRGGMAEIYLGKMIGDDGFSRLVCLKRILPHYASDQEFLEMFRDEAHICKRLQHANIVQVYNFEQVEGSYALIMEYVDGADLRTILAACEREGQRLSVPMAIYIVAMAARGLHYAHTRVDDLTGKPLGIIHRDISPQNILVSYQGEIKVTDFGIADAKGKSTDTKPGIIKGKYAYMSPEQVNARELDARSDVFALCIVLWEVLAMRRLFNSENEMQTIKNVQSVRIPHSLSDLNPEVTSELQKIVEFGLQKDPKKRYDNASTLEKVLLRYLNVTYPSFIPEDLGILLKSLLSSRMIASQTEIKRILSQEETTDLSVREASKNHNDAAVTSEPSQAGAEKEIELNMDSVPSSNSKPMLKQSPNQLRTGVTNQRHFQTRHSYQTPGHLNQRMHYTGITRRKSNWPKYLFYVALLSVLAAVGFIYYDMIHGKGIRIMSAPGRVKVQLDGQPLFNNQYVQSPFKLKLPKGKHELIIYRAGYFAKKYIIDGDKLNGVVTQNVTLNLNKKYPLSNTTIEILPPDKKVRININNGMFEEYTPFTTAGLRYKNLHSVIAYPYYPLKKDAVRCDFYANSNDPIVPTRVVIDTFTRPWSCTVR